MLHGYGIYLLFKSIFTNQYTHPWYQSLTEQVISFCCPEPSFPDVNCGPGTYTNSEGECEDCPVGTYQPGWSNGTGLYICKYCDEGSYCKSPGLAAPSGFCAIGFYCPIRSTKPTEELCLANHYCSSGVKTPIPCPPESVSEVGSTDVAECTGEFQNSILLLTK